jgi:hypothetical protein
MNGVRGQKALDDKQIRMCELIWKVLKGYDVCAVDFSEAKVHCSRTRFSETHNKVFVGADVVPGIAMDARSRMSERACLAHELAHAQRYRYGIERPVELPDKLRDEAEASLHASWYLPLNPNDRHCLVEDARDQLDTWLSKTRGANNEDRT